MSTPTCTGYRLPTHPGAPEERVHCNGCARATAAEGERDRLRGLLERAVVELRGVEAFSLERFIPANSVHRVVADASAALAAIPHTEGEAKCRRCSECVGAHHHWIDNDECQGEDDATHACKHCETLGDECETCGGEGGRTSDDGYDLGICPRCKGDGVIERHTEGEASAPPTCDTCDKPADEGSRFCSPECAADHRKRDAAGEFDI